MTEYDRGWNDAIKAAAALVCPGCARGEEFGWVDSNPYPNIFRSAQVHVPSLSPCSTLYSLIVKLQKTTPNPRRTR